jgi:hypothetical protein
VKECCQFCLRCRGDEIAYDAAHGGNVSVVWQGIGYLGSGDLVGSEGFKLRKKSPPTRLRLCASASDRHDTSLCMCQYISLSMYLMVASGCVAA